MPAPRSVLLVNPSLWAGYRDTALSRVVEVLPPLNLGALARPLLDAGQRVRILDLNLSSQPLAALRDELRRDPPDLVGLTYLSPQEGQVRQLVPAIRSATPAARVWLGGVGPTVDAEGVMDRLAPDGIVIGEGDRTLVEVLAAPAGSPVPGTLLPGNLLAGTPVPGVVHPDGAGASAGAVRGPARPLVDDLDELPLPAYELWRTRDYARGRGGRRGAAAPLETSRGCVYQCTFCTKAVFGDRFRVKSPARVVEEMTRVATLGYREVVIYDDTFNLSMRRAREIADRLVTAGAPIPWNCRVGLRADRVDADLLIRMRRAGCYRASFGVESGDQGVLDGSRKGTRVEQVERAFRLAREAGIETMAFFILGLPGDTEASMRETARFARRLDPTFAKFNLFMPLPSTPDWERLDAQGLLAEDAASRINFHRGGDAWRHPRLSPGAIRRAYLRAYASFYLRPRRLLRAAGRYLRPVAPATSPSPTPHVA